MMDNKRQNKDLDKIYKLYNNIVKKDRFYKKDKTKEFS